MAIEGEFATPEPCKLIERTRRLTIDCPYTPGSLPVQYSGRIDREKRWVDASGADVLPSVEFIPYTFTFLSAKDDVVEVDGMPPLTVAQLAAYIEKFCDQKVVQLRAEADHAAAAAAAEAEAGPPAVLPEGPALLAEEAPPAPQPLL